MHLFYAINKLSFSLKPMEQKTAQDYLKEIRDLNLENRILLQELVKIKKAEESRRKWRVLMNIFYAILPYFLAVLLAFVFYLKVQQTITDFQDYLKNALPNIPSTDELKTQLNQLF